MKHITLDIEPLATDEAQKKAIEDLSHGTLFYFQGDLLLCIGKDGMYNNITVCYDIVLHRFRRFFDAKPDSVVGVIKGVSHDNPVL